MIPKHSLSPYRRPEEEGSKRKGGDSRKEKGAEGPTYLVSSRGGLPRWYGVISSGAHSERAYLGEE